MAAAIRNKASNPPRKSPAIQDSPSQSSTPVQQPPARRAPAWRGNSNPPPSVYAPPPSSRLTHQPQQQQQPIAQQQPPPSQPPRAQSQPPTVHIHASAPDTPLPPPSLIGTSLTVSTRSGQRYQGTLIAVPAAADADASIQLRDVRDLANSNVPEKDVVTLPAGSLAHWESAHKANGINGTNVTEFRIDTDISAIGTQGRRAGGERELQAWQPDQPLSNAGPMNVRGDEATFGVGANGATSWDQFAVNERMFGVTTSFDEELYTTRLDRSHPDFKERERKAQLIANEILGTTVSNPHIAEERNMNLGGGTVDDSGANEEDKYAGVVRGPNAYVPPARRQQQQQSAGAQPTNDIPKLSVTEVGTSGNATGTASTTVATTANTPAATSPVIPQASSSNNDLIPTFRDFVTNEKQRLTQKRQAIVRSEMDKRMSELVKFSQSFKLNKPIPEDLVTILAKDEEKQRQIREKSAKDAASAAARTIGGTGTTPVVRPTGKNVVVPTPGSGSNANTPGGSGPNSGKATAAAVAATGSGAAAVSGKTATAASAAVAGPKKIPMVIQKIPPFNPAKVRAKDGEQKDGGEQKKKKESAEEKREKEKEREEKEKKEEGTKLNVNAPSFKFKPSVVSFKPGTAGGAAGAAAAGTDATNANKTAEVSPPNPFFGTRPFKKAAPVHVKEDFKPFKANAGKMPDPATVLATWPYQGKRFMHTYPAIPPNPTPVPVPTPPVGPVPSMPPPSMGVPVPMQPGMPVGIGVPPPPPYAEEDQTQSGGAGQTQQQPPHHHMHRQAAYGATMVYYPAYTAYPGQPPMMAGPHGAPPAGYMHSPFIAAPMHYSHMGPPNGHQMYAGPPHGMTGMPPQQYMQPPPPPGAYGAPPPPQGPPPPGSNGGRGSMPPTPMPPHAHAYYHPSPQLSHAVPYQMMMPPPPNAPPHSYGDAPPPSVQMGGVGHA